MTIIPSNGNEETAEENLSCEDRAGWQLGNIEVPEEDAYSDVVFARLR